VEFLPEIVPELITVLRDSTPAVARQAIASGIELFRLTLEKVTIQVRNLYSRSLNSFISWLMLVEDY
jgi:symplekin